MRHRHVFCLKRTITSNLRSAPNEDLENDCGVNSCKDASSSMISSKELAIMPNIEQKLMPKNSQSDNLLSLGLLPSVKHN